MADFKSCLAVEYVSNLTHKPSVALILCFIVSSIPRLNVKCLKNMAARGPVWKLVCCPTVLSLPNVTQRRACEVCVLNCGAFYKFWIVLQPWGKWKWGKGEREIADILCLAKGGLWEIFTAAIFLSCASGVPLSACTGADVRSRQMPLRLIAEVPQWRVCSARVRLYAVPRFSPTQEWCWRTRCPWERDVITRVKSVWLWTMSPQPLLRSRGADFSDVMGGKFFFASAGAALLSARRFPLLFQLFLLQFVFDFLLNILIARCAWDFVAICNHMWMLVYCKTFCWLSWLISLACIYKI